MKYFYIIFCFLITGLAKSSGSQPAIIDSVVISRCQNTPGNSHYKSIDSINVHGLTVSRYEYWTDTNALPDRVTLYTYSISNKPLSVISKRYFQSQWIRDGEELWEYDSHDSLLSYTISYYISGILIRANRDLYSYDIPNRQTILIRQKFIDSTGVWMNDYRKTSGFDLSGKITVTTLEFWSGPGLFVPGWQEWYSYLPNDSIELISHKDYLNVDSTVYLYQYDFEGKVEKIDEMVWYASSIPYHSSVKNYYYYPSGLLYATGTMRYFVYSFEDCDTAGFEYDQDERLVSYFYTALGSCGRSGKSTSLVFNSSGTLDSTTECNWTAGSSFCMTCAHESFTLVSEGDAGREHEILLSPNPVTAELSVFSESLHDGMRLFIFDQLGQLVMERTLRAGMNVFFLAELAAGIYFVRVEAALESPIKLLKL